MPINLNNKEGRKTFIDNNLPDLLTAINDTYGPIILEELLKRIEFTINEFNDQINEAFNTFKNRNSKRKEFFNEIKPIDVNKSVKKESEQSEWEKKLAKIESTK